MQSRYHFRLFAALAIIFAFAQATLIEGVLPRDVPNSLVDSSSAAQSSTSASSTVDTSSASTSSSAPPTSSSSSPPSSSSVSAQDTSSTIVSSTPTPSSTSQQTSSSAPPTSSSSIPSSSPPTSSSIPIQTTSTSGTQSSVHTTNSPSVAIVTTFITTSGTVFTSTGTSTVSGADSSQTTNPASLNDSGSKSSGMSSKTKNTIIGVVVGIAGAIVLGGLGFVAWRIWGKNKESDESDGLMNYGPSSTTTGPEKLGSSGGSAPSPFQSTLENYHQPTRNVNASSNF